MKTQTMIDFVDVNRVTNGYINNISVEINDVISLIIDLKSGKDVDESIKKLTFFTNRFAFSFHINKKIITSKQCENISISKDGSLIKPQIVDKENPLFVIQEGHKSKKISKEHADELFNRVNKGTLNFSIHKNISEINLATEYVFDTDKNEYLVFDEPIFKVRNAPKKNPYHTDYYSVYMQEGVPEFVFGSKKFAPKTKILYIGHGTLEEASKKYKSFTDDYFKSL